MCTHDMIQLIEKDINMRALVARLHQAPTLFLYVNTHWVLLYKRLMLCLHCQLVVVEIFVTRNGKCSLFFYIHYVLQVNGLFTLFIDCYACYSTFFVCVYMCMMWICIRLCNFTWKYYSGVPFVYFL